MKQINRNLKRADIKKALAGMRSEIMDFINKVKYDFDNKPEARLNLNDAQMTMRYWGPLLSPEDIRKYLRFIKGNREISINNVMDKLTDLITTGYSFNSITINVDTSGIMDAQHRVLAFLVADKFKDRFEKMFGVKIDTTGISFKVDSYGTGDDELFAVQMMQKSEAWYIYQMLKSKYDIDNKDVVRLWKTAMSMTGKTAEKVTMSDIRYAYALSGKEYIQTKKGMSPDEFSITFSEVDAKTAINNKPQYEKCLTLMMETLCDTKTAHLLKPSQSNTYFGLVAGWEETFRNSTDKVSAFKSCLKGSVSKDLPGSMTAYLKGMLTEQVEAPKLKFFRSHFFPVISKKLEWITNANAQRGVKSNKAEA